VGDPFEEGVEQGPQVDQDQLDKILQYVDIGRREGARLLTGGTRRGDKGYFVEPTVFADVTDQMKIATDEIFGPVQSILKFKTTEEVIARANTSDYGLASGIISKDINFINTVSRSLSESLQRTDSADACMAATSSATPGITCFASCRSQPCRGWHCLGQLLQRGWGGGRGGS
jgi:hypothetical protein